MRQLVRPLLWVALLLVVPIVPFLLLGDGFEAQLQAWISEKVAERDLALAAFALLASDIVLPVPSSMVNTLAGSRLGVLPGTLVCWAGMTTGSILGFALARWLGSSILERSAKAEDVAYLHKLTAHYGGLALAATRPIPILAEAAVLLFGSTQYPWRPFLLVVVLSNLAIALVYATLGWYSVEHGQLTFALIASVALPLAATWIARRILKHHLASETTVT